METRKSGMAGFVKDASVLHKTQALSSEWLKSIDPKKHVNAAWNGTNGASCTADGISTIKIYSSAR
jgi:hypothetical protein